jgi:hypothetical protein
MKGNNSSQELKMTASIAMTIETESRITERHSSARCGQMDDLYSLSLWLLLVHCLNANYYSTALIGCSQVRPGKSAESLTFACRVSLTTLRRAFADVK